MPRRSHFGGVLMDPIKRLIRKATLSYKGLFAVMSLNKYLMVNLGSPLMQMLCFTLVARYVNKGVDVSYWLIGNALVLTYFNAIFGVGSQLTQEKNSGTLKLLVASPSSGVSIFCLGRRYTYWTDWLQWSLD